MKLVRLLAIGLLVGGAACSRDTNGEIVTPQPVAGLRYVNIVTDTGAMDFRIVNFVGDAPTTSGAAFRTGGQVFGVVNASPTQPPYQPVRAGTPVNIRVFMNGTTAAVASTVMFDTTVTFNANSNYTFLMYGTARTGTAGRCCSVMILSDTAPATIAQNKFAVRVLNLTNSFATTFGAPAAGTPVDVRIAATNGPTPVAGSSSATQAVLTGQLVGGLSGYVLLDTSGTNAASVPAYRLVVVPNGTTSPTILSANLPVGARGSSLNNPFAGTTVGGTAMTVILVPRSVAGSGAPQATATLVSSIDTVLRSNDTVTVVRAFGAPTATACGAATIGAAAGDVINVSGINEAQYNGFQTVISTTAGAAATDFPACTNGTRARFRYRLLGTPTSPATGAPAYKVATNVNDYSLPTAIFLFDRQPPRTAP